MKIKYSRANKIGGPCLLNVTTKKYKRRLAQWYIPGLRPDNRGPESRHGTTASRPYLGPTQSPIQYIPGALSLWVKWQTRETDHSPPSSAEVNNEWSYTSIPQYAFMSWCLVKAQGQLFPLPLTRKVFIQI
jgi:hypothetical protein